MEAGVGICGTLVRTYIMPECPLCSGKVKPDDPAALALDWGMRTAKADAGATAFWRLATATEVCHNAAATGSRDPVQASLDACSFSPMKRTCRAARL